MDEPDVSTTRASGRQRRNSAKAFSMSGNSCAPTPRTVRPRARAATSVRRRSKALVGCIGSHSTDLDELAALAQETLAENPCFGYVLALRGDRVAPFDAGHSRPKPKHFCYPAGYLIVGACGLLWQIMRRSRILTKSGMQGIWPVAILSCGCDFV